MNNPARPPAGTVICALDDLDDPGARGFVFRADAALFAGFLLREGKFVRGYVDSCPHAGWPLAAAPDRYLTRDRRFIFCSGHGAMFRKEDGECISGPCYGERLQAWPVKVVGGIVRAA